MKIWIIGLIVLLAAGAAYYYFEVLQPNTTIPVPIPPVVVVEPAEEPAPSPVMPDSESPPETVWQPEPVEVVEEIPLPMLNESDPVVLESLGGLLGGSEVVRYIVSDNVISRVVATIDMLGSRQVPGVVQVVLGPESDFDVTVNDAPSTVIRNDEGDLVPQFVMDPANYQRYTPYVDLLETADTADLIENYRTLYPLFQEAFQQMGYPDGDFNERLVVIIDDLLATPQVEEPVELMKPEAFYLFTDPELESSSAGQKIMLRMGSENASRVKVKLREIKSAL
jgi:hypothetical protein